MKFFSGKEDSDAPGHGIEPGLVTKACYDSTALTGHHNSPIVGAGSGGTGSAGTSRQSGAGSG